MIINGMDIELITRNMTSVTGTAEQGTVTVTGDLNYRVNSVNGNEVCSPVVLISGFGQGRTEADAISNLALRCINDVAAVFRDMYSNS